MRRMNSDNPYFNQKHHVEWNLGTPESLCTYPQQGTCSIVLIKKWNNCSAFGIILHNVQFTVFLTSILMHPVFKMVNIWKCSIYNNCSRSHVNKWCTALVCLAIPHLLHLHFLIIAASTRFNWNGNRSGKTWQELLKPSYLEPLLLYTVLQPIIANLLLCNPLPTSSLMI